MILLPPLKLASKPDIAFLRIGGIGPVNKLDGLERLDTEEELTLEVYRNRQIFLVRLKADN